MLPPLEALDISAPNRKAPLTPQTCEKKRTPHAGPSSPQFLPSSDEQSERGQSEQPDNSGSPPEEQESPPQLSESPFDRVVRQAEDALSEQDRQEAQVELADYIAGIQWALRVIQNYIARRSPPADELAVLDSWSARLRRAMDSQESAGSERGSRESSLEPGGTESA